MKLSGFRESYYTHSGKASDVARQLALAGIALVWIFKLENAGPLGVPRQLLVPAALFVLTLGLDLLQYTASTLIWGAFSRFHERQGVTDETDLMAPTYFNWPSIACFWAKLLAVLIGYALVFFHIWRQLGEP